MKYDPENHHRKTIRLQGYDYASAGMYFITLCSYQRECLFGEIVDGEMRLNDYGQIVADGWLRSREIRQEIDFDAWVIMPNHLHGIVVIQSSEISQPPVGSRGVGANGRIACGMAPLTPLQGGASYPGDQNRIIPPMKPRSLSSFIAGFKSATTKQINLMRNAPGTPIWQRNYYVRVASPIGDTYHS